MKLTKVNNLRKKIKVRTEELGVQKDFTDTGHFYVRDNARYPSVTRKLSIIKDQGLMNWKMNRALEHIAEGVKQGVPISLLLEEAPMAPQLEFEGAGDIGTAVHAWRESWFNYWIDNNDGDILNAELINVDNYLKDKSSANSWIAATAAIKRCVADLKAQPIACELALADHDLKLGGMADDIWMVPKDGKWQTWLVDLKTSNIGNKDSYYLQVALYWGMFRKAYNISIDKVFILHTSKAVFGDYELIEIKEIEKVFEIALNALKLYNDLEKLKKLKKPEIATLTKETTQT